MNQSVFIDGIEYKKYNDAYFVSRDGQAYSMFSHKKLKHLIDCDGYHYVDIHGKHKKVHQLVYHCWSTEPSLGKQINHIDDNKNNNHIDNLYAGTQKQNILDCFKNNHRVGNKWILIVKELQSGKRFGFYPAKEFLKYSGHVQTNGSLKRVFSRQWFKNTYEIVVFKKGVTTNPDECKDVEWITPPFEARCA